jgi:hypothetical protein
MARVLLVASLALSGNVDQARASLAQDDRVASILDERRGVINWLGMKDRERLREGLKLAGWLE